MRMADSPDDMVPVLPQSGRHVIHTGIYMPFAQGTALGLHTNYTLLPGYLKKLGYSTHMVGKWCVATKQNCSPIVFQFAAHLDRPWCGNAQAPRAEYAESCAHGKRI